MSTSQPVESRFGANEGDDGAMLREVVDLVVSNIRLIIGAFIVGIALGIAYSLLAAPVYQADALIQIEEKKGSSFAGLQDLAKALDVAQQPVAGEIEIIKSREVVGKAIHGSGLDIDVRVARRVPYFANAFERSVGGRGLELAPSRFGLDSWAWGGEHLSVDTFDVPTHSIDKAFRLNVVAEGKWRLTDGDDNSLATGKLGELVPFQVEGKAGQIKVSKMMARPGETFRVTRRSLIVAYNALNDNLKVIETTRQSSVVRVTYEDDDPNEAAQIVNQLSKAYLLQNVSRRSEEAEKSLEFLDQQLPQLKGEVEKAEVAFNSYRLARQSVDLDQESLSLLNRTVDVEKQKVEAELKMRELEQRFKPGHPALVVLTNQLSTLAEEQGKINKEIKRLPETQQEFLRLKRDVAVNTDLYTALLNSSQQLRIARAGTTGNVRIIDFAQPNGIPVRPQKTITTALAGVFGILVGLGLAVGSSIFHPALRHVSEIEQITGLPTYATIPESSTQRSLFQRKKRSADADGRVQPLLSVLAPNDSAIEALRSMRMGLQFAMVGAANKNILIAGPTSGLGKSFVSANLAAVLASIDKRVLLIETDMRRPKIDQYFNISRSPGLSECLSGHSTADLAIQRSVLPNLDVLCAGAIPPNPGELLLKGGLQDMLAIMQDRYDYILLDSPPLLPVGDSLTVAKLAATVFIVLRAEESTRQHFTDALKRLDSVGVSVKGTIFNAVRVNRVGYGYRYQHYYYGYSDKG